MKTWRILLLLTVGILILAACQPETVEVTRVVTETVMEEGEEVEVTRVVEVMVEPEAEALPYEGVELNILTFTGPQIASRCSVEARTLRR